MHLLVTICQVQMASIAIPAEAEILKACKTRTLKRYSTVSETRPQIPKNHNKKCAF